MKKPELFKHNGVTTERAECYDAGVTGHEAHKWRPGDKTEYFTCPGTVQCDHCPNLIWRDLMVDHLQTAHADKLPSLDEFKSTPGDDRVATMVKIMTAVDPVASADGFHAWWRRQVDNAAPTIERKAAEYGSNSLAEMGRMFARAQGRDRIDDAEALEIGCAVYAKGKLERVLDAMLKGKLPSTDTWMDTMVYSAMSLYIREHGRWY